MKVRRSLPAFAGVAILSLTIAAVYIGRHHPRPIAWQGISGAPTDVSRSSLAQAALQPSAPEAHPGVRMVFPVADGSGTMTVDQPRPHDDGTAVADATLPPAAATDTPDPAVIDEAVYALEQDFRDMIASAEAGPGGGRIRFPLPGGRSCELILSKHYQDERGGGSITATVAGHAISYAALGYSGDAVAGTILAGDDGLFRVRYAGDGKIRVAQLDPALLPEGGESKQPPNDRKPASQVRATAVRSEARPGTSADDLSEPSVAVPQDVPEASSDVPAVSEDVPVAQADVPRHLPRDGSDTVIDLLVVFTPESRASNGGTSGMVALINAAVATANLSYAHGETGMQLRVVAAGELTNSSSGSPDTDLTRLQANGDNYMDGVHALRDQYKADIVTMLIPDPGTGVAGIGYLLLPPSMSVATMAQYAFNVVVDRYADSNLSLAHEIGHNLGAAHAAGDTGSTGAYSYSKGYKFTANLTQYRTVMAYPPGTRIPYMSHPYVMYQGKAVGVENAADNSWTLVRDKGSIAAARTGNTDWAPSVQGDMNRDGKPDLIWRNLLTGRVIEWLMNGASTSSTATLWPIVMAADTNWLPMATGDFNGDGQSDIIWRNFSTGKVVVWYMSGATTRSGTATIWNPTVSADTAWIPMATADLNGDHKLDIVWRNATSGKVIAWFMDGVTRTGTANIFQPATVADQAWYPTTAADMTGDGLPDIIWRNASTGRCIIWVMNGTTRSSIVTLWTVANASDTAWVPVASGDFDNDGNVDLVWRNSMTGRVLIWYMNKTTRVSTAAIWG
jgi:hypothetical protein